MRPRPPHRPVRSVRFTAPAVLATVVAVGLAAGFASAAVSQQRQVDGERGEEFADTRILTPSGPEPAIRCATPVPTEQEVARVEQQLRARPGLRSGGERVVVPIAFHVVRTSHGDWNVGPRQLRQQVRILNQAFRRHGFRFRIAHVRRYRETRFARGCAESDVERAFKQAHAIDPGTTLNVYSCRPGNRTLGWATFPWNTEQDDPRQGVVLLYSTFPGGGAVPYDEGDTLVHEVGHWLGLYHTFQGGCANPGDRVADTPPQASPTFGCPTGRDSCIRQPGLDPVDNFMDYSDDACMTRFTPGQGTRMRDVAAAFRDALVR